MHTSKHGYSEIPQLCKAQTHRSLLGDMTLPCNLPKETIGAISTAQAPAMLSVIPSNPHVTLGSKSYWSTAHRRGSQGSWSTGSSPKSEQLVLGMSWSPDLCDFWIHTVPFSMCHLPDRQLWGWQLAAGSGVGEEQNSGSGEEADAISGACM